MNHFNIPRLLNFATFSATILPLLLAIGLESSKNDKTESTEKARIGSFTEQYLPPGKTLLWARSVKGTFTSYGGAKVNVDRSTLLKIKIVANSPSSDNEMGLRFLKEEEPHTTRYGLWYEPFGTEPDSVETSLYPTKSLDVRSESVYFRRFAEQVAEGAGTDIGSNKFVFSTPPWLPERPSSSFLIIPGGQYELLMPLISLLEQSQNKALMSGWKLDHVEKSVWDGSEMWRSSISFDKQIQISGHECIVFNISFNDLQKISNIQLIVRTEDWMLERLSMVYTGEMNGVVPKAKEGQIAKGSAVLTYSITRLDSIPNVSSVRK